LCWRRGCVKYRGRAGSPRGFRGEPAAPPTALRIESFHPVTERNGIVIPDSTPWKENIQFFAWKPPEAVEKIDTLQPYKTLEFKLPSPR